MSLEIAKKLLSEVNLDDYIGKSQEEIQQILIDNGYDCTVDELKKEWILANPLSEDELDKVSGGGKYFEGSQCPGDYYVEQCTDTVEITSVQCWSGDINCVTHNRDSYTCTDTALPRVKLPDGQPPFPLL